MILFRSLLLFAFIASCAEAGEPDAGEPPEPSVNVQVPTALGGGTRVGHLAASTPPQQRHHYGLPLTSLRAPEPTSSVRSAPALPASADVSGDAPPVANQGDTESCQSWATGYVAMGWWANHLGLDNAAFAPMYLFSQLSGNCAVGGYITDALAILKSQGIDTTSDYEPMQSILDCATRPNSIERANAARFRATSTTDLDLSHGARTPIMTALAGGHPVILGMLVYPEFENASATNYIVGPPHLGDTLYGGHAITAFAYDATGVWIMNQWGTGWGWDGWAELSWDFITGSLGGLANVQDAHTINSVALSCSDSNASCAFWASESQCQENPNYMLVNCCASCATSAAAYREYAFHPWTNTGSCMDVYNDSSANLTRIEEYTCNASGAQAFTELDDGNGLITLYHPHSGKCVDVYNAGTANGAKVELYTCNHTVAQQFTVQRNSDGSVTFFNPHAQKCLDVTGGSPANLTALELYDCNGTHAQKWSAVAL
jgi:hypothetical protein